MIQVPVKDRYIEKEENPPEEGVETVN